jgi:hypothetical protein
LWSCAIAQRSEEGNGSLLLLFLRFSARRQHQLPLPFSSSCGVTLQRNAMKKVTTTMLSPSSSFVVLHRSAAKKATIATLPSPSSFCFVAVQQRMKR